MVGVAALLLLRPGASNTKGVAAACSACKAEAHPRADRAALFCSSSSSACVWSKRDVVGLGAAWVVATGGSLLDQAVLPQHQNAQSWTTTLQLPLHHGRGLREQQPGC